MSQEYRIIGFEASPYSVKVRSWFRYKKIPHKWILRDLANQSEFKKHAKLPLIPLVIDPDKNALQDSTPIIESLEQQFNEPSILLEDPCLNFISFLLEEFADEWLNKPMFHYRWSYQDDINQASQMISSLFVPNLVSNIPLMGQAAQKVAQNTIKKRMTNRLWLVGSSPRTAVQIEDSFKNLAGLLEQHLQIRPYIFGSRPSMADFGLWGQFYQLHMDPTPKAIIEHHFPRLKSWIREMLDPKAFGEFESLDNLLPTLEPILKQEVSGNFLTWSNANLKAVEEGHREFSVSLKGQNFKQKSVKYHAKSLKALKDRFQEIEDKQNLEAILDRNGCYQFLVN